VVFPPRNNSLPCYFHLGIIPSRRFPHYIIYSNQNICNKHVSLIHLLFKFGKYPNKKYVKYSDKDINTINQVKKVINIINISICKTINTRTYICIYTQVNTLNVAECYGQPLPENPQLTCCRWRPLSTASPSSSGGLGCPSALVWRYTCENSMGGNYS